MHDALMGTIATSPEIHHQTNIYGSHQWLVSKLKQADLSAFFHFETGD
jgi:hypothetical protein